MRLRFAAATLPIFIIIFVLLALPACKRKESPDNQGKNAVVPATPAVPGAAPVADNGPGQPGAASAAAPADVASVAPQPVVVAAGTRLTVKLSDDLGSATSKSGQTFSATLDKDVIVDGQTAIPAGSNVSGSVVTARPYGKYAGEAILTLKLASVNINNVDQDIVTTPRSFGKPIKAKGKVKKFFGGLVKRAAGDEKEVTLAADSTCSFTLKKPLTIQ